MQIDKLREILERNKLQSLIEKMDDTDKNTILKIGFLGEFNSGKSSLINHLLDQKVLPAMNEPTSKTIVEIEGGDIESPEYFKYIGLTKEKISALEFSDICTTSGDDIAYLHFPMGKYLKKGYLFVDTPGISSLDQSDEDITFGYLSNIDAAVLCQDIQFGALNNSIIKFILKPEVMPLVNRFVFAITKSDTKTDPEKIRANIISQLSSLDQKHNLGLSDIDKKVVLVSTKKDIDIFGSTINEMFFKRKQKLQEERREKEYQKIVKEALGLLKEQKMNADLDLSSIETDEKNLKKDIDILKKSEEALGEKFDRFEEKLEKDIENILSSRLSDLSQVNDEEELTNQLNIIEHGVIEKANMRASRYIGDAGIDTIDNSALAGIKDQVTSILKTSNIGKQIGTFVLVAVIVPGATAAANAAEGAGGLVAREAAKKGAKEVAKNALKQGAKEMAKQATKKAIVARLFKHGLDILDKINPIEIAGNIIQGKLIESNMAENIAPISTNLSFMIREDLEDRLEDLFEENREKMQNKKKLLQILQKKKHEAGVEFDQYIEMVSDDIRELMYHAR